MLQGGILKALFAAQFLFFMLLLSFADFFQKILSGTLSVCQTVWILISVQTISKSDQQTAKVISRQQKSL